MSRDPMDRFDEEWKAWTSRRPEISPEEAGRRVLARLDEPHGWRRHWSRFTARAFPTSTLRWATAAVVLALGVTILAPHQRPEAPPPTAGADVPTLEEGVVLIWLDSQTPLYMTWDPPHAEKGNPL